MVEQGWPVVKEVAQQRKEAAMAEPENRAKVTVQELMVVTLSMTDALE
jgi:hypothetical protein